MALYEGWFDGCCEPRNPGGHAAWGAVLLRDGAKIWEAGGYCGCDPTMSNNVAEYSGACALLEEAIRRQEEARGSVLIRGDSKLVVEQLRGRWRVRGGRYVPYYHRAAELLKKLDEITQRNVGFQWVPREENEICDVLSKAELKKRGVKFRIQPEV
jgi:ribonuclease HI